MRLYRVQKFSGAYLYIEADSADQARWAARYLGILPVDIKLVPDNQRPFIIEDGIRWPIPITKAQDVVPLRRLRKLISQSRG